MLETRAIVISVEGKQAVVESVGGGGCGKCDSVNGCGSSKLSQLFCSEPRRFLVQNDANAPVGATVQVVVGEGVLLRSALLMYFVPLVFLFAGAIFGSLWVEEESGDMFAALGALAGLISGYVLVRVLSGRQRLLSVAQPVILKAAEGYPGAGG
jgi:sigma-E factor negative regulatory protein RseC